MEKFTKYTKNLPLEEKPIPVYQGDVNLIKFRDWTIIDEADMVAVLPYFKDEGYVLLRSEWIPTYQWKYKDIHKGIDKFITVISGHIEEGETPQQTLRRELYEEAGIVLNETKELDIGRPLHISKGNLNCYFPCLLELNYNDYQQTKAPGDGSLAEKKSQTIKISLADLDQIVPFDLISGFLMEKLLDILHPQKITEYKYIGVKNSYRI
jgi:hypothetical protein